MSKIVAGKGDTKYNIYISNKISKRTLNQYLKTYNKLLVVTDSGIPKEHLKNLKSNFLNNYENIIHYYVLLVYIHQYRL